MDRTYMIAYGSECPFCGSTGEIAMCGCSLKPNYYWRCSDHYGCGARLPVERTYSEAARKGHRRMASRLAGTFSER